jgi:large subunit ribosomal protein L25
MNLELKASVRELGKKSDLNKFRREGFIPAVVYGEGQTGTNILLEAIEFQKQYKKSIGEVAIFELNLGENTIKAFIKEKQIHPLTREFLHVDFVELHKGKPITLNIPIHFTGVAKGTKAGGLLELLHRTLEVSCLPKDIPDEINVDVSNLDVGEATHFKDVVLPENVTSSMSDVTTIAAVRAPKRDEEVEKVTEDAMEGEEAATEESEASKESAE